MMDMLCPAPPKHEECEKDAALWQIWRQGVYVFAAEHNSGMMCM